MKLPEVKYHLLSFLNPFSLSFFLSIRPHKYIIPVHGYAANCNLYSPSSQLFVRKNRAACISSVFRKQCGNVPELVIFTICTLHQKTTKLISYLPNIESSVVQNNEFYIFVTMQKPYLKRQRMGTERLHRLRSRIFQASRIDSSSACCLLRYLFFT